MDPEIADGTSAPNSESQDTAPQSRYQKRIDTVVAQREDALRALDASRQETAAVMARLEAVEGRLSGFLTNMQEQQGPKAIDRGIDKYSEQEILGLIQEEGITDPAVLMRGVKELARRQAVEASNAVRAEMSQAQKVASAQQQANQRIISDFPDVLKSGSDLNRAASEIANEVVGQLKRTNPQLADGLFDKAPELAYLVYAAAAGKVGAQTAKTAQIQADVLQEQQRYQAASDIPMNVAAEASAKARSPAARSDWRSDLRNSLPSIQSLQGVSRAGRQQNRG